MDVYDITVKVNFYVLADSEEEAKKIALDKMADIEATIPAKSYFNVDAYHCPNQADYLKAEAINS